MEKSLPIHGRVRQERILSLLNSTAAKKIQRRSHGGKGTFPKIQSGNFTGGSEIFEIVVKCSAMDGRFETSKHVIQMNPDTPAMDSKLKALARKISSVAGSVCSFGGGPGTVGIARIPKSCNCKELITEQERNLEPNKM
ncbi:hypothetical protein NC653_030454 [Populus alba x Populus x berolinensis]|uniref:Uncharacterized protein n=1 Tax=Populus alba x Populus x berolinensis TaxID=444605 RepID=A0AAD6LWB5_9ROSI|nr:hypothetical protein NC653_030454 [Populus alba x Populus x berolinensis]